MSRNAVLIVLLALAASLLSWEAYEAWTGPLDGTGPPPAALSLPETETSSEEDARALEYTGFVSSVVARPVFRSDRQPYREPPPAAGAVPQRNYPAELARFTVLGVLVIGDVHKAIVTGRAVSGGAAERWEVGPGETLPGFTVKEVRPDGLALEADDQEFLLPLFAGGPKTGPGSAPIRTEVAPSAAPAPAAGAKPATPATGVRGAPPSPAPAFQAPRPTGFPAAPGGTGVILPGTDNQAPRPVRPTRDFNFRRGR